MSRQALIRFLALLVELDGAFNEEYHQTGTFSSVRLYETESESADVADSFR